MAGGGATHGVYSPLRGLRDSGFGVQEAVRALDWGQVAGLGLSRGWG
jgi:hypothetical protein